MLEVFISFAREDMDIYQKLDKHLSNLKQQERIHSWSPVNLISGEEIEKERLERLNAAHIILLLISADFIASPLCYSVEMKRAIARHEANQARVIPLLIRSTDYDDAPFAKLACLPSNGRPVKLWSSIDNALKDIVKGIREVITDFEQSRSVLPSPTKSTSVFSLPFLPNPYFTGREKILNKLHENFSSTQKINRPQAIRGLGGIGKTHIAIEYAYRFRGDYRYVFWVRADSQDLLMTDFASLTNFLYPEAEQESNQTLKIAMVKQWLQGHENWLLILDNVEDIEDAMRFLSSGLPGHILFTTRTPVLGTTIQEHELTNMDPVESIRFILRRAKILDLEQDIDVVSEIERQNAAELAELLGYLPLALAQAGAYIERTKCGLAGYLERYQKRRTRLLQDQRGLSPDHPEPVTTTWSLSFERVEAANALAADLLCFCAFLHPDAIPETLLRDGATEVGSLLQAIEEDIFILDDAIVELLKYSLIRRSTDGQENVLTIHRLVQAVLKDGMRDDVQRLWAERTVCAVSRALLKMTKERKLHYKLYLAHTQVCAALIERWNMDIPEALQLLSTAGQYLHNDGVYRDAELLQQQLLKLQERIHGKSDLKVASTLNELGELARLQGHYQQAKSFYEQALSIREQILGLEDTKVAISLNNLARSYHHFATFSQAEIFYKKALAIFEQKPAAENYAIAHTLNDLATLYSDQGKYVEAEELYKRALAIREQVLGPEHPDIAKSLNNLASLYDEQGKDVEAEELYKRVLATCERVLGSEHPTMAASLNNLANLYNKQGKDVEAEELYKRALAIREQVLGPEHPETAMSLNNLASLYDGQGKNADAEVLLKRALAIREQVLGPEHPETAMSLNNLGVFYSRQGKSVEAEELMKRALAIRERILGEKHPDTAESLVSLAMVYSDGNDFEQATLYFLRGLAIFEQVFSVKHPNTVNALMDYASMLRNAERYKKDNEKEKE